LNIAIVMPISVIHFRWTYFFRMFSVTI
jgi:hypothetical protein